jgi:predicted transcriptional regulator
MSKDKNLTPVEWEIMNTIWELNGKPSVRDVLEKAFPNGEKAYTTVQTVMNTLVKKGLLKAKKIGMVNFYALTISKEKIIQTEMSNMVSRVFNGSIPAMANFLFKSKEIGLDEIETIKKLLDEKEDQLRGKQND